MSQKQTTLTPAEQETLSRREKILTDCLLRKCSTEEMVRTAAQLMGCPIILTTNTYRVIRMESLGQQVDDPVWEYAARTGYCSAEAVAAFEQEGITREVLSSDGAFVLRRGIGERIPRILQKISVSGKTGAYIGVFQTGAPLTAADLETTDYLCRILSLMLEWSPDAGALGMEMQESILSDLLKGVLTSEAILAERMKIAGWKPKPVFRCALLTPDTRDRSIDNRDYLSQVLQREFPDARVLPVPQGLLLVLNFPAERDCTKDEAKLDTIAGQYRLRILLSSKFSGLLHLRAYAEACLRMDRLTDEKYREQRLLCFDEVLFPLLAQILTARERRAFSQPQYRRLLAHDAENGTEYCRTLRTYILCGCSSTRAAEALFLHRNTMARRLERISELSGLDLRDGAALFHFFLSDQLENA